MFFPRQTIYSLNALGYMASQPKGKCIKVRELAARLKIPRHFLGKVLTELVKKRLVRSTKGPAGGFVLDINPETLTVYHIINELGILSKNKNTCVMGLAECNFGKPCVLHEHWEHFKKSAESKTQKLTLKEFSSTFNVETPNQSA